VQPVYGITRPAQTWNPIKINFQHMWLLIKDAWHAKSWKDKLRIWLMPTGWRPADVEAKYPVYKIEDVYHFEKYNPPASTALQWWSWVQLITLLVLLSYFFAHIAEIGSPGIFIYGGFLFLQVYAFTDLADRSRSAIIWELVKNLAGAFIIFQQGDWFGASRYLPHINSIMYIWFLISTFVTACFVYQHWKEDSQPIAQPA